MKNPFTHLLRFGGAGAIFGLAWIGGTWTTAGVEIWNGPDFAFVQPDIDPTQPANQDRITPNVWLTRAMLQGMFNAYTESGYTHYSSPAGTEWAYGTLANYSSLTYATWESWNGQRPPAMVGRNAVLHLIAEDIYLSIRFTSWGGSAGGFSYVRSTAPIPEPSSISMLILLAGFACVWTARRTRNHLRPIPVISRTSEQRYVRRRRASTLLPRNHR